MTRRVNSRTKGKVGELAVRHMLENRDYEVDSTRCGMETDDMIATKDGTSWSVEVKRTKLTNWMKYIAQAQKQANDRKMPWMLVIHIPGTSSHVVLRKSKRPIVWTENKALRD